VLLLAIMAGSPLKVMDLGIVCLKLCI